MDRNGPTRRRLRRVFSISALAALVLGSLITGRELLRTDLSSNAPPIARAGADRSIGVAPLQLVVVSLDGSQSSDPDGDTLDFEWRGPGGNVIGSSAIINVSLAEGSYVFALTVSDGRLATASDSVRIDVVLDTVPPAIIPPEDLGVSTTEAGGARGADAPALAAFLAGGDATDQLDTTLIRLSPQVAGADVDNATLFPVGTTPVTFRFRDSSGNVGTGTADLTVSELKAGDLFVGAGIVGDDFGNTFGVIHLVHGGSFSPFCQSPIASSDPGFFNVPRDVMVDSRGRVVFLAPTAPGLTLFRCDGLGSTPQKLAVFPRPNGAFAAPGDPVPFPGSSFETVSGLHLARIRKIVIDNKVDDGIPKLVTDDAYVVVLTNFDVGEGHRSGFRTVRYLPKSGAWEDGTEPPQKYAAGGGSAPPDAVNHAGDTYFAHMEVLRKFKDPLRLDASANIGGVDFRLVVSIFGGFKELDGILTDDSQVPNISSGCLPAPPLRNDMPFKEGGFASMSGFYGIAFDEDGQLGLVLTTGYAPLAPYLANVSEAFLNEVPLDEPYFQQPFLGCIGVPVLDFGSVLPFFDPSNNSNSATVIASAPGGLVATQLFSGRVVRVKPGDSVETIAEGLVRPTGIAAYPAAVPPASGLVVVVEIDSPVNVLLTGNDGRRIGVDPVSGLAVNDFGENGFDSGPGEPRYYAIRNPSAGEFDVGTVGTGSGPYAVNVSSLDFSNGLGRRIRSTGSASPGGTASHDFTLGPSGELAFVPTNGAPVAAAGSDQVLQATSPAGAVVSLDGSASSDPDEDSLEFTWAGPFGALTGPIISPTLFPGVHSITLTVNDGHGGSADDTVLVTVEPARTPTPTETAISTPVPTNTASPTPTHTSTETSTPVPTATPTIPDTPLPSETPTPGPTQTPSANSMLTSLSPAKVWVGLKNSDDVGIRFDLAARVYLNGVEVGSGQLNSVAGGSSGFSNARLNTIALALSGPIAVASGNTLSVEILVRNACSASGKSSGTARLWYNGQPIDDGERRDAGSRFDATIDGSNSDYYLRQASALGTTAGSARLSVDKAAGARCSAFKAFGTWTTTLP